MDQHHTTLLSRFTDLLTRLSGALPAADLDYVREELDHREYEDALENLAALALRSGRALDDDAMAEIEALAQEMQIGNSSVLRELRASRDTTLSAE